MLLKSSLPSYRLEQLQQRLLTLTADRIVHVMRRSKLPGYSSKQSTRPRQYGTSGKGFANFATTRNRANSLRARHHRNSQESTVCLRNRARRVSVGCGSRLPSTMANSSRPSSTAAIARIIGENDGCEVWLLSGCRERSLVFKGLDESLGAACGCFRAHGLRIHAGLREASRYFSVGGSARVQREGCRNRDSGRNRAGYAVRCCTALAKRPGHLPRSAPGQMQFANSPAWSAPVDGLCR